MMSESLKTLRASIQAFLKNPAGSAQAGANANLCESGPASDFNAAPAPTISAGSLSNTRRPPRAPAPTPAPIEESGINRFSMDGIYRVHFAGFDRAAYKAMEDTLLIASQSVNERFVPTDPVSMALGTTPDVLVINLNHPDATQLGKTLRPAPGVPVVWVSISPEQKGVGDPGSPLFTNLVKAMQDVLAQRGN